MKQILVLAVALGFVFGTCGRVIADEKKEEKKTESTEKTEKTEEKTETTEQKASGNVLTCKMGKEVRTLEKKEREGGGCEVIYTKGGEGKSIANAKNELTYCDQMIDKMKEKLVDGGFTCE